MPATVSLMISLDTENPKANYDLGRVHFKLGNMDDAIKHLNA